MNFNESDELLTQRQVADTLRHKSTRTLQRWHDQRIGPPRIKVGRTVYYRKAALVQWLIENERDEPLARRTGGAG